MLKPENGLQKISRDDKLRENIVAKGHKAACTYGFDVVLRLLVDVIKELDRKK